MSKTDNRSAVLWDIPTRVFHWSIVLLVALAWWSGEQQDYERHAWVGYSIIVLVVSRLVWGFVGSTHSRFGDFVRSPARVWAYARGRAAAGVGHNPLGGWSVLCLLALLLLQSVSGLFNSDDVLFEGPLYFMANGGFRDAMGVVHELAFNALLAFIALHILSIAYYVLGRKQPLIKAMIKGRAQGREGSGIVRPWWWGVLIATAVAVVLWWIISVAPQPQLMW